MTTKKPTLKVVGSEDTADDHGMPEHAGRHLLKNLKNVDWEGVDDADYMLTVYTEESILFLTNLPSASTMNLHLDTTKMNLLMGGIGVPEQGE